MPFKVLHRDSNGQYMGAMDLIRTFIGVVCLVAVCSADAQTYRDTFTAVTPKSFDNGGEVSRQFHLHAESYLRTATIARTGAVTPLGTSDNPDLAALPVASRDGEATFAEYVASDPLLDAVIVVHGDGIVFEAYPNMEPWQRHFGWSVTKVFTSTAVAALAGRERIDMNAAIETYLPTLADTAWDGIRVQDIADMASGIDCLDSDGYQEPTTCIYTMEEALGVTAPTGRTLNFLDHVKGMQSHREPGTRYEYVSANTNVLMLLIEAVTQQPFAEAVRDLLWDPIGAEADALMVISPEGYAYGSGGLHARLHDVARFGQIYTQPSASRVLSPTMIERIQASGVPLDPSVDKRLAERFEAFGDDTPVRAGWQWDMIWADGGIYKGGYSGQGLYVDPGRQLVVAWFGTGLDYNEQRNDMLSISRQLARSGLFDDAITSRRDH